jgi:8-oxo-dGTP diphosphatase
LSQPPFAGDVHVHVRAAVVLVEAGRILLVPNFDTDRGPLLWVLPGGGVEFGEPLEETAAREVYEETGLHISVGAVFRVSEAIRANPPWHSITIAYTGRVIGGDLKAEEHPLYWRKEPRWFSRQDLDHAAYHPQETIDLALPH